MRQRLSSPQDNNAPPDETPQDRRAATAYAVHLPAKARELITHIGLLATLSLIGEYGGQAFQIPKGKRRKGVAFIAELSAVIGVEAAQKMAQIYGGENISIPACRRAMLAVRDAELQARFDTLLNTGVSARRASNLLAKEFGIAQSTVWRASKRYTEPAT